ncbi:MAG: potassium transporter TrkG [Christensenellales bacterium]
MQRFKPAQIIIFGFLSLILLGTVLLSLPISAKPGRQLGFLDNLFTSTSAVCITGLSVADIGLTFSLFGQIVILFLIQAGGLGVMTVMSLVFVLLGKRITLSERMIIKEALNEFNLSGVVRMVLRIIKYTVFFELAGAAVLAIRFVPLLGLKGVFYSVFHSVSAFCNAGFDLMGPVSGEFSGLSMFASDPVVIFTLSALIILGGLGFAVIADIFGIGNRRRRQKLCRYTKLVLAANAVLLVLGLATVFSFELGNPRTLGALDTGGKIISGIFQAITPRTAGFSTLDQGALLSATRFVVIILMFIGASPAGTGGGIKTTTVAIVTLFAFSGIKKSQDVNIFGRRLAFDTVRRALSIMVLALLFVLIVCFAVIGIEGLRQEALFSTQNIVFEVVSAFGTVGISAGITPLLCTASRVIIIITMFVGRIGLMTLVFGLSSRSEKPADLRYPKERFMVG